MPLLILGVFIVVPIIEIAVFIQIGGQIGLWNTIAVVIVTAMIGTWMLRAQGLKTLDQARRSLERQVFPVAELFDGMCLLIAGVLLLTPGFVTDAAGFLLLAPPLRRALRTWLWSILQRGEGTRIWTVEENEWPEAGSGGTIDGEFREIHPDSPWGPDRDRETGGKPADDTRRLGDNGAERGR